MTEAAENIHVLRHDPNFMSHDVFSSTEPVIFGLMGAAGGVGVTSLACQFAYRMVQQTKSPVIATSVALISLDFENSALSYFLDQKPSATSGAFAGDPSALDADQCKTMLSKTAFGFDALVLPCLLDGNQKVRPQTVLSFLDKICAHYEYIILDIPRLWSPWTHAALGAADRLGVVTELTVPSLHQANDLSNRLTQNVDELSRVDFIVNKFERRSFRNNLKISDAETALAGGFVHTIANNADKVREAINRGEPVGAAFPEVRFAKDANDILEEWLAATIARRGREQIAASTPR